MKLGLKTNTTTITSTSRGLMDQDATWHGGRPRPRPHCVKWRPSSLPPKGAPQSHFSAGVYSWLNQRLNGSLNGSGYHFTEVGLGPGDAVLDGDPVFSPTERGTPAPTFRSTLLWHGRPSQLLLSSEHLYNFILRFSHLCGPLASTQKNLCELFVVLHLFVYIRFCDVQADIKVCKISFGLYNVMGSSLETLFGSRRKPDCWQGAYDNNRRTDWLLVAEVRGAGWPERSEGSAGKRYRGYMVLITSFYIVGSFVLINKLKVYVLEWLNMI